MTFELKDLKYIFINIIKPKTFKSYSILEYQIIIQKARAL